MVGSEADPTPAEVNSAGAPSHRFAMSLSPPVVVFSLKILESKILESKLDALLAVLSLHNLRFVWATYTFIVVTSLTIPRSTE